MAKLHPAVAAGRVGVRGELAGLDPGALVLVACSGGADSLALAATTAFVAPRQGVRAGAVIVDHGLQPGSAQVADDAASACRALGLSPVRVARVRIRATGDGMEADARRERYRALETVGQQEQAAAILLGHTMDDQAETVLLALARGSGSRSLSGMPVRRGLLRRPFLGLRRSQTEAICRELGLEFWDDPTNGPAGVAEIGAPVRDGLTCKPISHESAHLAGWPLRSQVRGRVMPVLTDVLGDGVVGNLARTADLLRADADLLDQLAAKLLADARRTSSDAGNRPGKRAPVLARQDAEGEGGRGLDVATLAAAHPALRLRALRAAAIAAGCPPTDMFAVHAAALDALITDWHGQGPVSLPAGRTGVRVYGRIFLRPPNPLE